MADEETDPTPTAAPAEETASTATDERTEVSQPLPGAPLDDRPDDDRDEAAYKVVLPAFHGPLDLLLHLIRQHKVDIYDIPIVLITQQFNKYLEAMAELDLEVAADYIYMAALLIHIKSKMLLPRDDEAGDDEDPRKELVDRLVEYQRFKAVAESFAELDVLRMGMWQRPPVPIPGNDEPTEIDMSEVSLFDLIDAFRTALARYKQNHPTAIELKRITHKVSDKMREIYLMTREKSEVRLGWLLEGRGREELIAIFLGTLELVRLGGVGLKQSSNFGEIVISSTKTEIDQATFDLFDDR